tara:strand:+ start:910 stop:1359 length:450 start_codon:yes stop_codon:yes gene_type:complete
MSIKYQLICDEEHKFEGWFPSIKEFERQQNSNFLLCPICDSHRVTRDIMAPNVVKPRTDTSPTTHTSSTEDWNDEHIVMGSKARLLLKQLEAHVKKNFEDVGDKFADEARKADRGERDEDFYGNASDRELKDLIDEGIDIFAVPKILDN